MTSDQSYKPSEKKYIFNHFNLFTMKKYFLFMSVLASLFLAGCSQEEIAPNGENDGNGEATTSYMAVNLVSSDVLGTRATGNGYEDGDSYENKVSKVRFYFFNGVGGTANVKTTANGAVNYYDWENPTPAAGNPNDVEKILSTTIVINTKKGDGLPVRIAAVINPDNVTGLGNSSLSLTSLKGIAQDYATSDLTSDGKFVMFNSVYVEDGKDYSTTDITDDNICKSEADAKDHPVNIYVERSVAKVSVILGTNVAAAAIADGKIALKTKVTDGENLLVGGKQVYLKLGGWELAAETSEGRLVKKINPGWEGTWWKGTQSPRTFWAINEMSATNVYNKSYTNISKTFGETNYLYTNENAQKDDIDNTQGGAQKNTKVIVKGELVDENGNPFTIVRHVGARFADDPDNFNNLKGSILTALENKEYFYYYKEGNDYHQITAADLAVVVPTPIMFEDSENNCYVYTQLSITGSAKEWYKSTTKDPAEASAYTKIEISEINGTLKDKKTTGDNTEEYIIDRPLVWKSGMTYYYYEIKHLEGSNAIGVVRNHIYKTTITNIAGLGTPVYDPNVIIYPEKPEENDHYIAAQINILSWRVVNNSYDLEW